MLGSNRAGRGVWRTRMTGRRSDPDYPAARLGALGATRMGTKTAILLVVFSGIAGHLLSSFAGLHSMPKIWQTRGSRQTPELPEYALLIIPTTTVLDQAVIPGSRCSALLLKREGQHREGALAVRFCCGQAGGHEPLWGRKPWSLMSPRSLPIKGIHPLLCRLKTLHRLSR